MLYHSHSDIRTGHLDWEIMSEKQNVCKKFNKHAAILHVTTAGYQFAYNLYGDYYFKFI